MDKIKILIVDDHLMFLEGLKEMLAKIANLEVVGSAKDGTTALNILSQHQVDIVISDLRMNNMSGLELCKKIKEAYPKTKILMVSMHNDPHMISQLLKVGVTGYILKNTGKIELVEAINSIYQNKTFFSDEVKSNFINSKVLGINEDLNISLTKREKEVLKLIAAEHTTTEIADKLFISLNTVETHRKNILKKFNVRNSVGIVKRAIELDLLS